MIANAPIRQFVQQNISAIMITNKKVFVRNAQGLNRC